MPGIKVPPKVGPDESSNAPQLIQNLGVDNMQFKTPSFMKKSEKAEEKAPEPVVTTEAPAPPPQKSNSENVEVVCLVTESVHIAKFKTMLQKGRRMSLPREIALVLQENHAVEPLER